MVSLGPSAPPGPWEVHGDAGGSRGILGGGIQRANKDSMGLGEWAVIFWLGSARAPDLPVTTFFFWRWYGIASKYKKNKKLSRARAPEILRAVHPKVGI